MGPLAARDYGSNKKGFMTQRSSTVLSDSKHLERCTVDLEIIARVLKEFRHVLWDDFLERHLSRRVQGPSFIICDIIFCDSRNVQPVG